CRGLCSTRSRGGVPQRGRARARDACRGTAASCGSRARSPSRRRRRRRASRAPRTGAARSPRSPCGRGGTRPGSARTGSPPSARVARGRVRADPRASAGPCRTGTHRDRPPSPRACHSSRRWPRVCRSAWGATLHLSRVSVLEQVQSDVSAALKAGDRERAGALRVVASELQRAHKDAGGGEADEVAVLQRERKRRIEAAEAYREAGRDDLVSNEEREAELIDAYLPEQLSDEELAAIVGDAVAESGASSPSEMGRVMSMVMPRVQGRADGKRVSALVKEKLSE